MGSRIREPCNATLDDIQGEWQDSDGVKIFVKAGIANRNGFKARISDHMGVVDYCGWKLMEKRENILIWSCDKLELVWTRIFPKARISRAHYFTEVKSQKHKNEIVDLVQSRLLQMKGIRTQVFSPDHINLCLYDYQRLMAAATLSIHREQDFLEVIFLATNRSCSGYGASMIKKLKDWAHKRGVHHIIVNASNNAIGFFEKQSFVKYDASLHLAASMVFPCIFKVDNATLMVCDLSEAKFVSDKQRALAKRIKKGMVVEVRYGHHKPKWIEGSVSKVHGVKVLCVFESGWAPEWLPVSSPRIRFK